MISPSPWYIIPPTPLHDHPEHKFILHYNKDMTNSNIPLQELPSPWYRSSPLPRVMIIRLNVVVYFLQCTTRKT
jgi:hypothetical protein